MAENQDNRERRVAAATQPLMVGAFGVVCGLGVSLIGVQNVGAMLTLAGVAMLGWGLHRLGRLGPDPPSPR